MQQTAAQARAYARRRQATEHERWNRHIRQREFWRCRIDWGAGHDYRDAWNMQADDAEAFGWMKDYSIGGNTPIRMVRWNDERTLWDEIHVLAFAFGAGDDA